MTALKISHLNKQYRNGTKALKDISLDVEQGDFFGLLGPNGAGKTTIIGIITSLVKKSSGKLYVYNVDIDQNINQAKSYIGVVPQEFNLNIFQTVKNVLIKQAGYYGIPPSIASDRAEKYLKKLGLWGRKNSLVRFLSGGMKRRLMIARALVNEPKILILDEPTAGVDIELRRLLWRFLQEVNKNGTTIILTTHYLEEAEQLCKNIAILDEGKILKNTNVKGLIRQLESETFIFDMREPIEQLPSIKEFKIRLIDPCTLEIDIDAKKNLNDLFSYFNQHNLVIKSMRNKANRLEELFIKITGENHQ